ncbi:phosphotransferase [bacterium]|nr:phosphotransferase [bacterium]
MHTRQNALNDWLKTQLGHTAFTILPLAGDASFRRYFRVHFKNETQIVMDAPPDKEPLASFLHIGQALHQIGIRVPTILAVDEVQGFALLDDLGDRLFLSALSDRNADTLYHSAMQTLTHLQQCPTTELALPLFDRTKLLGELNLFRDWFLKQHLGLELTHTEEKLIDSTFDWLIADMLGQPQVFVHRDYHSRNIMIVGDETHVDLAIIDFQDAVRGPFTYDLVSLLKDCYIQWPPEQILTWLTFFYNNCRIEHTYSLTEFKRAFDRCGLQRHLKVLGIFCRLHLRDNKTTFLNDLPLVFNYVMGYLESCETLYPFYQFMLNKVQVTFLETT